MGTGVNRKCQFINEGTLEITITILQHLFFFIKEEKFKLEKVFIVSLYNAKIMLKNKRIISKFSFKALERIKLSKNK